MAQQDDEAALGQRISDSLQRALQDGYELYDTLAPFSKVHCCGKRRAFFCPVCFRLLYSPSLPLPPASYDHPTSPSSSPASTPPDLFPFSVDVILHDALERASGVHARVLSSSVRLLPYLPPASTPCSAASGSLTVHEDGVPDYAADGLAEGTFVLFPCEGSVPLASVLPSVRRLVVLDCKWSRPISRLSCRLGCLQAVHLSGPPKQSLYWRWHGEGEGRLATLEALYAAAYEVNEGKLGEGGGEGRGGELRRVMQLFAFQAKAMEDAKKPQAAQGGEKETEDGAMKEEEIMPLPWTEEFKETKRRQRAQNGTERQSAQKEQSRKKSKEERRKEDKRFWQGTEEL